MRFKKKYFFPLFLIIQIIFLNILSFFPNFVERFYSNGIFQIISKTARFSFGKIGFSVGDVVYGFLIVFAVFWIYKTWHFRRKEKILTILSFLSIVYLLFHLLWAFNYYRLPLFEKMNIKREYSEAELVDFTKKLIAKTNQLQFEITKDTSKKVVLPYSQEEIFLKSQVGYYKLAQQYPDFEYTIPSRKKSLFSLPLTYMGFGGYLNPFTNEAQVNDRIPMVGFPNTICHEMAHQIGYGSESECNFIGFLACTKNDDLYFQYSAYQTALRYCMNNIGMLNEAKFYELKKIINPGILKNYKESSDFWLSYHTIIDTGFEWFYDKYLKANMQKDGIDSYSKYVDLLVNYYQKKDL